MDEGEVFICYSREDVHCKEDVNRFMQAMGQAKEFRFSYWDDSLIESGVEWEKKIVAALGNANAGLLLISADFLASEFIQNKEVPQMLARAHEKDSEFRIFPLLVRPCPWEAFEWLRKLQLVNDAKEPISGCTTHRTEEILTSLMWEISQHIEKTNEAKKKPEVESEKLVIPEMQDSGAEPVSVSVSVNPIDFEQPVREGAHQETGVDATFLTNAGVVHRLETASLNPNGRPVIGLICIFRTRSQRTWFVVTDRDFFCVLDDVKTSAGERRIQWQEPLGDARPVSVHARSNKATGLMDIGRHRNWLYSQQLHPDSERLRKGVERMIEVAERS